MSGCALAAGFAAAAGAQSPYPPSPYQQPGYVNPFAPLSDADKLAQQLRQVAANPTDLYALINAANLSLKVGDTDAAAALFTRADRISPQHPRVKAGMGRLLVQAGRPGEALRRFAEAQTLGATLADFGPDRALAYDLVGEQPRAQREYRALLRLGSDDETVRRYALSLGISGLKEPALALLEPLNRRSDRGAWRARAFVLAMTGDRAGAERIATTMMPSGMAQGLAPFFDRLPRLGARERAFAVNFGETRPSPTRLADARLVPQLPALSPEPDPFPPKRAVVQVAAPRDEGKKKRRSRRNRVEPVRIAAAQPYVAPLPPPPAPTAAQLAALTATRLPYASSAYGGGRVTVLPPPADAYRGAVATAPASRDEPDFAVEAVSALAANSRPTTAAPVQPSPAPPPVTLAAAAPRTFAGVPAPGVSSFALAQPAPSPAQVATPPSAVETAAVSPAPGLGEFRLAGPTPPPASVIGDAASGVAVAAPANGVVATTAGSTLPPASETITPVTAPPTAVAAAITPATGAPPPPAGPRGDAVLAAILANIKVPEAELAVTPAMPPPAPAARPRLLVNVEKTADADKAKALAAKPDAALPNKDARGRFVDAKGKPLLDARGRPLDAKAAAAWKLAEAKKPDPALPPKDARGRFVDAKGKPLLDPRGRPLDAKAAAAWKLADAKKKPDPVKGEPQRYWVQVAGGANEATLAKAWREVAGQAPSLKGRQGWTTPLRATNRVLTGPLKTTAEAMSLVNQLKKEGVSAFMFTSDAGQKVTRLAGK